MARARGDVNKLALQEAMVSTIKNRSGFLWGACCVMLAVVLLCQKPDGGKGFEAAMSSWGGTWACLGGRVWVLAPMARARGDVNKLALQEAMVSADDT
jgi:hypothetical protein